MDVDALQSISLSELSLVDEKIGTHDAGLDLLGGVGGGSGGGAEAEDDGRARRALVRKGYSGRSSKFLAEEAAVMKQKLRGASGAHLPQDKTQRPIHMLDAAKASAVKVKTEQGASAAQPSLGGAAAKPRFWTPSEDATLIAAVEKHGDKVWKHVATLVSGRTSTQCIQRWKVLKPGLKKGHWSPQEDRLLIEGVQAQQARGTSRINWSEVCKRIPKRSCKQCRERWVNHLNPDVNKGQWTPEEDQKLLELQDQTPRKWALIARQIPGRTENMVKVRFNILDRQRKKEAKDEAALSGARQRPAFPPPMPPAAAHTDALAHGLPLDSSPPLSSPEPADTPLVSGFGAGDMDFPSVKTELDEIETEPLPSFHEMGGLDVPALPVPEPMPARKPGLDEVDFLPFDFNDFPVMQHEARPAEDPGPASFAAQHGHSTNYATSFSSLARSSSCGVGSFSSSASAAAGRAAGPAPLNSERSYPTSGTHVLRATRTEPAGAGPRAGVPAFQRANSDGMGGSISSLSFSRSFKEAQELLPGADLLDSVPATFDDKIVEEQLADELKALYAGDLPS